MSLNAFRFSIYFSNLIQNGKSIFKLTFIKIFTSDSVWNNKYTPLSVMNGSTVIYYACPVNVEISVLLLDLRVNR